MSSIEITSRFRTIINRAIEMKFDEFVEDGIKTRKDDKLFTKFCQHDEDPLFFQLHYKGLSLRMKYSPENRYHQCDDYDEEQLVLNSHNLCDCDIDFKYEIYITNGKGSCFYNTRLFSIEFCDPTLSMKRALVLFNKIPDTIEICQCGEKAVKEKWCEDCYIWRSEHPTDEHCAICHENEGQYIMTECNHYFHKHCWNQLHFESNTIKRKCPLCRTITDDKRC